MAQHTIEGFHLSPHQKHLWLLRPDEQTWPFLTQFTIAIVGPLDQEALVAALEQVVARHEILHTSFQQLPGMELPLQVIEETSVAWHPVVNISGSTPDQHTAALDRVWADLRQRTSPSLPPLLQAALVRLSGEEHRLLLCLPALCADAPSLSRMVRELYHHYDPGQADAAEQDELLQYADFASWQNGLLDSSDTERERGYWQQQDYTALAAIQLPFERPETATQPFDPRSVPLTLPDATIQALEVLAAARDTTVEIVLLACWNAYLWRFNEPSAFQIGVAYSGRDYEELEAAIGQFTKVIPLTCRLTAADSFESVIAQVEQSQRETALWQEGFFWEQISTGARPRYAPYSFEFTDHGEPAATNGVHFAAQSCAVHADRFMVKLSCQRVPTGLVLALDYDAARIDQADAARMARQFQQFIASACAASATPISQIDCLPDAERALVLTTFNATATAYPATLRLPDLFEAQVARTPDAPAVIFGEEHVTYAALNARANQLAQYLQQRGVQPGSMVAICVERSLELVIGLLAVLKAGGAYVPLDPSYPAERLLWMLHDSQATVLLTYRQPLQPELESQIQVIDLEHQWPAIAESSADNLASAADPDDLAYLIYTSGSTGTPKGAMISHRAICNHMLWMQDALPLTPADRVLQKTPVSFDASVWEFYAPLLAGAQLVVAPPDVQQDSALLSRTIAEQQITIVQVVPSLLRLLLNEPTFITCRTLRRVCCGGEALPTDLQAAFFKQMAAELYNLYGPSETTIDAVAWKCDEQAAGHSVPIGRPISNMQVYVLDTRMQPVAIGMPGELYLGGLGLGRGYWNRPDLTAAAFVPNPFGEAETTQSGARLYRTGDLARYQANGALEFLGRRDQQVKLRGFRVELGEIEAALRQHEAIQDAVVIVHEETSVDRRLVAYVVGEEPRTKNQEPNAGEEGNTHGSGVSVLDSSELRRFLLTKLPEYMIPSAFFALPALPRLPNGKLDWQELAASTPKRLMTATSYVAPRTPEEEMLVAIWQQILKVPQVGVHDHFFELGGHSLLATQVVSAVRKAFEVELPVRSLFEAPTIAELADLIATVRWAAQEPPTSTADGDRQQGEL